MQSFQHADSSVIDRCQAFQVNKTAHKLFHALNYHYVTDSQKEEHADRVALFAHLLFRNVALDTSTAAEVGPMRVRQAPGAAPAAAPHNIMANTLF